MFLVTGITGRVGGAAARHLLAEGRKVRALVRDPQKAAPWAEKGVEIAQGDWEDTGALTRALAGVEGAYLMMPPVPVPSPDFREAKAIIASYTEALSKAPPPRVVALSSIGSEKTSGLGLITSTSLLERALEGGDVPIAFVRAASFFENYLFGLQAGQSGVLPSFYAPVDRKIPMIATDDIGAEVARLLTGPGWTGVRVVELGSPASPDDVAEGLGKVLGREVKAQAVPREAWAGALEQMGLPKGQTGAYEEMLDSVNSGWISFGVPGVERVEGTTPPQEVFEAAKG